MYIIELLIKLNQDIKSGIFQDRIKKFFKKEQNSTKKEEENEKCDHLFVPIDSTGRVLACSKCGEILKRKKKKANPFNTLFF